MQKSHVHVNGALGLSYLRLLASVQLNSNMSESLRHLCVPPCVRCVHCVPCLPLYVFHCAKIDSVLTQPTQGKKRIVGARLNVRVQSTRQRCNQIRMYKPDQKITAPLGLFLLLIGLRTRRRCYLAI